MSTTLQDTLKYSFYATVVIVILTLTGMFTIFEARFIVEDVFNLSNAVFVISLLGTGYFVATRLEDASLTTRIMHSLIGTIMAGIGMSIVVILQDNIDMRFVFRNLEDLVGSSLLFLQEDLATGLLMMMGGAVVIGVIAGVLPLIPSHVRNVGITSLAILTIVGLLQDRLVDIITLPDTVTILAIFGTAYLAGVFAPLPNYIARIATGALIGIAIGVVMLFAVRADGLERGSVLYGAGGEPVLLSLAQEPVTDEESGDTRGQGDWIIFIIMTAAVGLVGVLVTHADGQMHNAAWYLMVSLMVLGILNWQDTLNLLGAVISLTILLVILWFMPQLSKLADIRYRGLSNDTDTDNHDNTAPALSTREQTTTRLMLYAATLGVMLITPVFAGQYITSVLDLVMLYIIMGIGLNVMIGYAGLLDLGYVASYAIGAYTAGILTTPSIVTIGCTAPAAAEADFFVMCTGILTDWQGTGVLTFWESWPLAVLFSAFTGMMLGVPVLRLRGDYLAIVTLGFGEIVNRLLLSNTFQPLLGGAQGISPIPSPVIDLTGIGFNVRDTLSGAQDIYYLFLFGVFLAAFVVLRLANSRLGRAWRAIRADEDVAEAIGIHLVGTKLLAFGISSAFAGLGGAIFGGWLQGIFPNSFTLFVSVNVLSLIIIGGMGSIPGVVLGAFMLIGLPEALREIQDYRLLAFGSLLVVAMLLKPDGLLPPKPARLSEKASRNRQEVTA